MSLIHSTLLLIPLLTSIAYLQFALDETFLFGLFISDNDTLYLASSMATLPRWVGKFSRPGIQLIVTLFGTQLMSALGAVATLSSADAELQRGSVFGLTKKGWLWAGVACTVAHFTFAPWAAPHLVELGKMDGEIDANEKHGKVEIERRKRKMVQFLYVHNIRTFTVNVASCVCFGGAVLQTMAGAS